MTILRTERLTLRPLAPDDPLEAAHAAIDRYSKGWRERSYGPWGLFREGRLIGHAGLNFVPEFGETEVLWSLHPESWGHGFATEAARAALDFGFRALDMKLIFAVTRPDTRASQAVMTRLGLTYRKNVVYHQTDSVWFDIARESWAD